jgi:hypothetical protein
VVRLRHLDPCVLERWVECEALGRNLVPKSVR